jgi:hypothetical protein
MIIWQPNSGITLSAKYPAGSTCKQVVGKLPADQFCVV